MHCVHCVVVHLDFMSDFIRPCGWKEKCIDIPPYKSVRYGSVMQMFRAGHDVLEVGAHSLKILLPRGQVQYFNVMNKKKEKAYNKYS